MSTYHSHWCVVCMKPYGTSQTRRFPDGCVAHEYCFLTADYDHIRQHMNHHCQDAGRAFALTAEIDGPPTKPPTPPQTPNNHGEPLLFPPSNPGNRHEPTSADHNRQTTSGTGHVVGETAHHADGAESRETEADRPRTAHDHAPRERSSEPRLVYVDPPFAWFATSPEDAWGDDWDDAPHDCNAGEPYPHRGGEMVKVAFDGELEVVGGQWQGAGSTGRWGYLSVEQINAGAAPWLVAFDYGRRDNDDRIAIRVEVPAHVSLDEFAALVKRAGGVFYYPHDCC